MCGAFFGSAKKPNRTFLGGQKMNDKSHEPDEGAEPAGAGSRGADAAQQKPSPLEKPWVRVALGLVLVLAVLGGGVWGWHYWTVGQFIQTTDDAYLQADSTTIAPKVGGYVDAILVAEHQQVAAGALLVRIESDDYRVRAAQAEANLQAAHADQARAVAEAARAQASVQQAEAQLAMAETAARFAENQVTRYAPLAKTGAATAEQMSNLVRQRDEARAKVAVAQAELVAAREAVNTAFAAVEQADAGIGRGEAALAQARIDLTATEIRAPISGRIGDKTVAVGQFVQPGLRLMSVVPVDEIYLTANFKETQIELMRVGQPATLNIDALPSEALCGRVESISPGTGAQFALLPPENATGNFTKIVQRVPVRIRLEAGPEARKVLVPGLSVEVEVDTRSARDAKDHLKDEAERVERTAEAGR